MKRRIAVFLDGTWNSVRERGNVYKLFQCAEHGDPQQFCYYSQGAGIDRPFVFGVLGVGIVETIHEAYRFIAAHYRPGDDIYLFGFSRGAWSVRTLAGLIRWAGVLRESAGNDAFDADLAECWALYEDAEHLPDDPQARQWREQKAVEARTPIRFVGVWDTVGRLGVPRFSSEAILESVHQFHDTDLSSIVVEAVHALALDEHRPDFPHTPWTAGHGDPARIEQRWFAGAHGNVGGGYSGNTLSRIPLIWVQNRAEAAGLQLAWRVGAHDEDWRQPIVDSHTDFFGGYYHRLRFGPRFFRPLGLGCSETIDATVVKRIQTPELDYRPPQLCDDAGEPIPVEQWPLAVTE